MTLMDYLQNAKGKTLVIGGHRGHSSALRENTVRNFQELNSRDIPYIEIDVQLTKDRQLVIFHDLELDQSTELSGTIREYTLEELRASFEINTVAEVLDWAKHAGMGIAFELKFYPHYTEGDRKRIVRELAMAIGRYGYYENCFVFGKDYGILRYLRELDRQVNIAIIAPGSFHEAIPLMRELDAFMYLDWLSGFDKALVSRLHEEGFLADGSVVDTPQGVSRAMELGLDMIESNIPEEMIAVREGKRLK